MSTRKKLHLKWGGKLEWKRKLNCYGREDQVGPPHALQQQDTDMHGSSTPSRLNVILH